MFSSWLITIRRNTRKYAGEWSLGVKIQMPRWAQQFLCVPARYGGEVTFTFTKRVHHKYVQKIFRINLLEGQQNSRPLVMSSRNPIPNSCNNFIFSLWIANKSPCTDKFLNGTLTSAAYGIDTLSLCNTLLL